MKFKTFTSIILATLITGFAYAQKLPTVQSASLRIPANIKIDGKANEWDGQFQAYNKAVDVFYTMANDDENLYVIIEATKPRIIEKIISTGITFSVNDEKSKSKESHSLTFPVIDLVNAYKVLYYAGARVRSDVKVPAVIEQNDTVRYSQTHSDSLIMKANNLLAIKANTIDIKGMKDLPNEPVSIYNEEKIRAIAAFDKSGAYVYELAIPLKYLNLSTSNNPKISYTIKIDGRLVNPKHGLVTHYTYPFPGSGPVDVDVDLNNTTDFSGEYTLAKN